MDDDDGVHHLARPRSNLLRVEQIAAEKVRHANTDLNVDAFPEISVVGVSRTLHVPLHDAFYGYLYLNEQLEMMSIVKLWGVCTQKEYTTHTDLQRKSIPRMGVSGSGLPSHMARSVPIEFASSSAGITISKQHSRLKLDVVETPEKGCIYRRELLFYHKPSTAPEAAEELFCLFEGISNGVRERGAEGERGWGSLVGDPQDNAGIKDVVKLMLVMFLFRLLCRDTLGQFLL